MFVIDTEADPATELVVDVEENTAVLAVAATTVVGVDAAADAVAEKVRVFVVEIVAGVGDELVVATVVAVAEVGDKNNSVLVPVEGAVDVTDNELEVDSGAD